MKLHKWAEKDFSKKCSEGDAVATRPDEDIYGWDFFVEFPDKVHRGRAESRPPRETAFVQVKSTIGSRLKISIKLSNMLEACRSSKPWFVILVAADRSGRNARYFGRHVWKDLMYDALKAVRRADIAGDKLHGRYFSFVMTEDDLLGEDVVGWMRDHIEAIGPRYEEVKGQFAAALGFEETVGAGSISLEGIVDDDLVRAGLGFGNLIPTTNFQFTPMRFGIPDPEYSVELKGGMIGIEAEPVADCQISVRGPAREPAVSLPGRVFSFVMPGSRKHWVRYAATPFEIVHEVGVGGNVTVNPQMDKRYDISHLTHIISVLEWSARGRLDIQVTVAGGVTCSTSASTSYELDEEHEELLHILKALSIAQNSGPLGAFLSINELLTNKLVLMVFSCAVLDPVLEMNFVGAERLPTAMPSIVYFTEAKIGEWAFRCIVLRPVTSDTMVDGARRIQAGSATLLETYAGAGISDEGERIHFVARYEAIAKDLAAEAAFDMGNIMRVLVGTVQSTPKLPDSNAET